ncbi:hypothetical protein GGF31_008423 [Allomyces arbusculus]|nr:hypothetical protein GGF31_008423 [Allomyces arbusculus]
MTSASTTLALHAPVAPHPLVGTAHAALWHNVADAPAVLSRLLAAQSTKDGSVPDPILKNVVLLNADALLSPRVLEAAVLRAMTNVRSGIAKTRTLGAEVMYALAPSTNIRDAMATFGVTKDTSRIVALHLVLAPSSETETSDATPSTAAIDAALDQLFGKGPTRADWITLGTATDAAKLAEMHSLDPRTPRADLERDLIEAVALKGYL